MTEYIVEFGEHPSIEDKGALREKIVRCRDCKHYEKLSDDKGACHPLGIVFADMDDCFCAWAVKRKEGGE